MNGQESIDPGDPERIKRFGTAHPNRYDTLWERFLAGIIDTMILLVVALPIQLVYDAFLSSNLAVTYFWEMFSEFIFYGYTVSMHGKYGRTLGKRAMGLKILDKTEQKEIGFRQAIARDLIPIIVTVITCVFKGIAFSNGRSENYDSVEWVAGGFSLIWFLAEIGSATLNRKRRAIHDYLAGTVVVKL